MKQSTEQTGVAVMSWTCIQEVWGSNSNMVIRNPDRSFSWFSSVSTGLRLMSLQILIYIPFVITFSSHVTESVLRSWQSLSYANSPPFMEPEGSLPCSQEPITGLNPKPDESCPHLPPYFHNIHSNVIYLSMLQSSDWSHSFTFSEENFLCTSHVYRACYYLIQHHITW